LLKIGIIINWLMKFQFILKRFFNSIKGFVRLWYSKFMGSWVGKRFWYSEPNQNFDAPLLDFSVLKWDLRSLHWLWLLLPSSYYALSYVILRSIARERGLGSNWKVFQFIRVFREKISNLSKFFGPYKKI